MPERSVSAREKDSAIHLGSYGLGIAAISVGLTAMLQVDTRMSTPGWKALSSIVSPDFWGAWVLVCGLIMLVSIPMRGGNAILAAASVAISLAVGLRAVAGFMALNDPTASGTGPQWLLVVAALFLAHGGLHLGWFHRDPPR